MSVRTFAAISGAAAFILMTGGVIAAGTAYANGKSSSAGGSAHPHPRFQQYGARVSHLHHHQAATPGAFTTTSAPNSGHNIANDQRKFGHAKDHGVREADARHHHHHHAPTARALAIVSDPDNQDFDRAKDHGEGAR